MNIIYKVFTFLLLVISASCHNNDPFNGIVWDKESNEIIMNGIQVDSEEQSLTLTFTYSIEFNMSVQAEEEWLSAYLSYDKGKGQLMISCESNDSMLERVGLVELTIGDQKNYIQIHQKGLSIAVPEKTYYNHGPENGAISIYIKANGSLDAYLYPNDCKWASISEIRRIMNDEWIVTVILDENPGFGRITSLEFKIDNKPANKNCGPCIVQEPASFGEEVSLTVPEPGMLQVLMGNNIDNLKRIRKLSINGGINGIDFPVLRKLFVTSDTGIHTQPISIDLSACSIVSGYRNPYEYFGWVPNDVNESIPVFYGEIPQDIFTNAKNLVNIVLPESLKVIGKMAFSECSNLESIEIPSTVEEIGSKAFWQCSGMKSIILSSNSNLTTIGNQAFTTNSLIESLSFPECLTYIAGEAFLGCTVSQLHLHWIYPFDVRIVPKTEICTLYVPTGTAYKYRETRNWCKFERIVEE